MRNPGDYAKQAGGPFLPETEIWLAEQCADEELSERIKKLMIFFFILFFLINIILYKQLTLNLKM